MATNKKQNQPSMASQFLFGGLAGMAATCVVQPIDLIKTRMQLSGEGGAAKLHKTSFHAFVNIAQQEGVRNMYRGLSAGLFRQITYTTTRLGVYNSLSQALTSSDGKPPGFFTKLFVGMVAGGTGAVVGTPAEVALIRMTSDGRLPPAERRGYKNVFDALTRIVREEGIGALWRGCTPTVLRAVILNAAQLASYAQSKEVLLKSGYFKDNIVTHFAASLCSGFLATAVSMPVDIAKTRIQTMKIINGVPEYKNTADVIVKTINREGVLSLWKGFTPYFLRLGPHTILTFIIMEQLNKTFYPKK